MKQVLCINPKGYNLTEGGEYEVANNPTRGYYKVVNDNGRKLSYHESLFQDIPEETPIDSEDAIVDSIAIRHYHADLGFDVMVDGDITRNLLVSCRSNMRLIISCGINYINDINGLLTLVKTYIPDRGNAIIRVVNKIIKYIIDNYPRRGMTLISTNINNNNNIELLRESIELLRGSFTINESIAYNPNSDNNIVLYTIVTELPRDEEEDDVEDITSVDQLD